MKKLSVLFAIFISSVVAKAGPILVGGGAGGSEFSVVFARSNLPKILGDCLSFSCGLTQIQQSKFQTLLVRSKNVRPAVFKSAAELASDLYKVNASEVWFNKDLLWLDETHTKPYEVSDAVLLWLEILDQDMVVAPADLSLLKTRIAGSLQIERTESEYDSQNSFQIVLWQISPSVDQLYVSSSPRDTFELTPLVQAQLGCSHLESFKIQSPSWISATPVPNANEPDRIILKLSLNLNWECGGKVHSGFGAAVTPAVKKADGRFEFDRSAVDIFVGEK